MKKVIKRILFRIYVLHHRFLHRINVLPMSRHFGRERGTPVGRYYVEAFLKENAHLVKGTCLEFGDDRYKAYFSQAGDYKVLDVVDRPGVDFVCDIHDPAIVPDEAFDTILCIQVFEHLSHPEKAAESIFKLLKPDGLLLLTAPFINPVHYVPTDYRRFTPECIELMLKEAGFTIEEVDYGGNSLVGTGSLLGMVLEDFSERELRTKDPIYPYNVLVRARKPGQNAGSIRV